MNKDIAPVLDEISALLKRHDMVGLILVGNETHTDFRMEVSASWSCAFIERSEGPDLYVRVRAKRADFPLTRSAEALLGSDHWAIRHLPAHHQTPRRATRRTTAPDWPHRSVPRQVHPGIKAMKIDPNDPRPINQLKRQLLTPGIWEDQHGHIHFAIPELLALFDLPDTPEERQAVMQILKDLLHKHNPGCQAYFRATPDDEGTPV